RWLRRSCRRSRPRSGLRGRRPPDLSARSGLRTGPELVGLGHRAAGLLAAARLEVAVLRDHHLAAEDADDRAVLVVADGLDVHDAPIVLRLALGLVQDRRLAVDRVAVER